MTMITAFHTRINRKQIRVALTTFCSVLLLAAPNFAAGKESAAFDFYAKHDYSNSLRTLDSIPVNSRSAEAEYYRALNLQALHRYDEAYDEFQAVARQKKAPRLAILARQGIAGLANRAKQTSYDSKVNNNAKSRAVEQVDADGYVTNDRWKVYKKEDLAKVGPVDTSSAVTIVKTSGCPRH